MTTFALARPRVVSRRLSVVDVLFLSTIATVTFAKLQWEIAGSLSLSDVVTGIFLAAFAFDRLERVDGRMPRVAAVAFGFFLAFLAVYLIGYFNLDTSQSLAQWAKGMFKFLLHFLFLVAGAALVVRRGERFYWITLGAFCGGVTANALYAVLQLGFAEVTGGNLDAAWLQPLTGGASQINIYGAIEGAKVFRPNALTGDPNHLGIELLVPILVLLPLYLRLDNAHRLSRPLLVVLAFLFLIQLATLSRSGLLGLGCGFLVLLTPYRHLLVSRRFLLPLAGVGLLMLAFVAQRADFFGQVLRSRLSLGGGGSSTHFVVYGFVPDILQQNPLFGLGLNNFSVYYEFITGRTNFGPHSFYVALFVETGIVGAVLFVAFLVWLFRRLGAARRIGRALTAAGDPVAAHVRPLAWGLTAALVGTLVANAFYLTMTFYYFFVVALLAITPAAVFGKRLVQRP